MGWPGFSLSYKLASGRVESRWQPRSLWLGDLKMRAATRDSKSITAPMSSWFKFDGRR